MYQINLKELTIENDDSHGPKRIIGTHNRTKPHVQYINDDNRIWAQRVTDLEYFAVNVRLARVGYQLDGEPMLTAEDVSMDRGA